MFMKGKINRLRVLIDLAGVSFSVFTVLLSCPPRYLSLNPSFFPRKRGQEVGTLLFMCFRTFIRLEFHGRGFPLYFLVFLLCWEDQRVFC